MTAQSAAPHAALWPAMLGIVGAQGDASTRSWLPFAAGAALTFAAVVALGWRPGRRRGGAPPGPDEATDVNRHTDSGTDAAAELLAAVVATTSDAVITEDLDGVITSWNPAATHLFGWTAEQVLGTTVDRLLPDGESEAGILTQVRSGAIVPEFSAMRRHRDGQLIAVSVALAPIRDAAGRIIGASKIVRDMTARQREEAMLQALLDSAPDATIVTDARGTIVRTNHQVLALFGWAPEDLFGQPVEALLPQAKRAGHIGLRKGYQKHPVVRPMGVGRELYGERRDGSTFPAEVSLSPVRLPDGLLVSCSVRDVSERARVQALVEAQNLELQNILYVASHDLREPLRGILGFTELLRESATARLEGQERALLDRVEAAGRRLDQLVDDLLQLSRARRMDAADTVLPCGALVADVLRMLEERIRETGASVAVAEDLPALCVNRVWAERAIYNLLLNALKFTAPGCAPEIEIAAHHHAKDAGLVVRDRGIGLRPEDTERIFGLFERSVGRDYEGTGAGLAIVRQVAERHGGHAWAEPRAGGGATFYLTFGAPAEPAGTTG